MVYQQNSPCKVKYKGYFALKKAGPRLEGRPDRSEGS